MVLQKHFNIVALNKLGPKKKNHEDQNNQDILEKDNQDEDDDGFTFLKCPKIYTR